MADNDTWVSQLRKGALEIAILALLRRREMYGFEIVSSLSSHPELAITAGTIYPLLSRLKKAALIKSTWQESPVGPPRKYYGVTTKGAAELEAMSRAWSAMAAGLRDLLDGRAS